MCDDNKYMSYAISLAKRGGIHVLSNPLVGAVIVCDNKIVGEGYHKKYGEAHAEVNAIKNVKYNDKHLLPSSTMYVSLEPCCHTGKTPPCTSLIIANKIKRVVIAMRDPFPKVDGEGIKILRDAGVDVKVGVMEKEAMELNRDFIIFHTQKRPYIVFKWAQTIDGFIDSDREDNTSPEWLTGESCKRLVHKWRSESHGIMVGSSTIRRDNAHLDVREWTGRNPHRFSIDRKGNLDEKAAFFTNDAPVTIFTSAVKKSSKQWITYVYIDFDSQSWINDIMSYMYKHNIKRLFIEGGKQLFDLFLERNLLDESHTFISNRSISELRGGETLNGITAPILPKNTHSSVVNIDGIIIKTCYYA